MPALRYIVRINERQAFLVRERGRNRGDLNLQPALPGSEARKRRRQAAAPARRLNLEEST